jgi:hypothetical protein
MFPIATGPKKILTYRRQRYRSSYLVRWNETLLSGTDLCRPTPEGGRLMDYVFRLRPMPSESHSFFQVTPNFAPDTGSYIVRWIDTWENAEDLSRHAGMLHDFWSQPYNHMERNASAHIIVLHFNTNTHAESSWLIIHNAKMLLRER